MLAAGNFGSPTQLLIIAVIILLLFGGKRLRSLGSDIGQAIKGFKNSMSNDDKNKEEEPQKLEQQNQSQSVKQTEKNEHKE
jgi:sec-independent protein translocase protein TatA